MATRTVEAIEWVVVIAGLLSSVVQQNHCRDLRPGYGHPLRDRETARVAITCRQRLFPTCYGSEFISRDLDLWAYANNVTLDFSPPGKPTDNGFIEALNSKFLTLADAREKMEDWRRHYNEERPHSAIGYNVPIALHNPGGDPSPSP